MKIMRWCLLAQKTRFQLRILNVPLRKPHIGVWALRYALHLRCEKFLLGWQGGIVLLNLKIIRLREIVSIISEKINCFEEKNVVSKNRLYILGRNPF